MGRKPKSAGRRNRINSFACRNQQLSRLVFRQAFFQPFEPLLGGLLDKGHVFGEMLLRSDFSFFASFLLIEPELCDERPVFLVELFPDCGAA